MKHLLIFVFLLVIVGSCSPKDEEHEPDYDNMVMVDEEEEWSPAPDSKNVADCDPQEFMVQDPEGKTENSLE
jgi:hypothetical protein